MEGLKVGEAAARTRWSPRMLRYIERAGLVDLEISDLVFAARLRREAELRKAVDGWLAGADDLGWVEWEQHKHERLLAA